MCIRVTNKHPESTGPGYKLFGTHGRFLVGSNLIHDNKPRPTKKWIHEKGFRDNQIMPRYGFGWHIYKQLADAIAEQIRFHTSEKRWGPMLVRCVRYRGAFVEGTQKFEAFPTVVAKEICIIPGEVK